MKEEYKPDLALPFVIDRKEAIEIIRKNFAKKMFIPKDFCSTSSLESLQGRYVPFWMYDMETHVHFEGEGRKIRTWTEGDYDCTETSIYRLVRDFNVNYDKIPVDASKNMPDEKMDLVEPYKYTALGKFRSKYLSGFQAEIYDENKERTGATMKHNDWNMKPGEFHLTVLGVLMRPDGKYLITRRRMDKEWAAGWWEVPGGGVRAGEDSKDAVIREIKEETGIDVTNAEGGYAFSYKRVNPEEKNNYFVDIYKFVLEFDESDVKTQEEEVSGFAIADLNEIKRYADEGIFLHYDSIRQAFEE